MALRWIILAVLFLARTTMAFQFQSVAALSPLIAESYAIGLAEIGLLIGLYMTPGIVVAIPGGVIAARFGEKRIVVLSMVLMVLGGLVIAAEPGWHWVLFGRLLSGIGGISLNVVMTKMVVDWFVGREISTAMGIFINSWPLGIALALLCLPWAATLGGLVLAWTVVVVLALAGLVLFVLVYRAPEGAATGPTRVEFVRLPMRALFLAGLIWAFYNTALAMVFSFGPALLTDRGWSLASASSTTSLFMLLMVCSLPLGGLVADRYGRRDTVIMVSLVSYTVLIPLTLIAPGWAVAPIFLVLGFLYGLGAGSIVSQPSLVLTSQMRSFGIGVYYAIYYAVMTAAPRLAGELADRTGNVGAAFLLGAALMILSIAALAAFRRAVAAPLPERSARPAP